MSTTLLNEPLTEHVALRPAPEVSPRERQFGVVVWLMTALALLALATGVIVVKVTDTGEQIAGTSLRIYENEDEALRALVALGYVPSEAFDAEAYWTKRFMDVGAIPRQAYDAPLYSAEELETMRLVREGVLPKALLQTDTFLTKRLVNQGLVPREAVR